MIYAFWSEDSSWKTRIHDVLTSNINLVNRRFWEGILSENFYFILRGCQFFNSLCIFFQGSWIVKQSVGKKACLVGQALEINYFQGKNYIEVGALQSKNWSFVSLFDSCLLFYKSTDLSCTPIVMGIPIGL